jgi:hypothetical protein
MGYLVSPKDTWKKPFANLEAGAEPLKFIIMTLGCLILECQKVSLALQKYFKFCAHTLLHIPFYSLEVSKMAGIKIWNAKVLVIKRMEKRILRE